MGEMATEHRRNITWDLDGVLINSRRAVEEAYRAAGIEMPPDAWGKSAGEWMNMKHADYEFIHRQKQEAYPEMLRRFATPLAGARVLREEWQVNGVRNVIVTSASLRSAEDAVVFLGLQEYVDRIVSTPRTMKKDWIQTAGPVCHVDDQDVPGCAVPVIRYTNDPDTLWLLIGRYL